jgi:single-strand DNA-binding protein
MSRCVNTVILLGNCGKDPEIRYTASGKPVAKLSLAINESFKDGKGEWQERTHWVSIVAWQRLAEIVGEYVEKGTRLYVQGRLNTDSWEDRNTGQKRSRILVVAQKLIVIADSRQPMDKNNGSGGTQQERQPAKQKMSAGTTASREDSDIPF